MFAWAVIGFLGGLLTSISSCVLPVLPVVLAAGTSGLPVSRDRPSDGDRHHPPAGTSQSRKPVRKRGWVRGGRFESSLASLSAS
jgi:cytochrome c biogenesis protein CcdA